MKFILFAVVFVALGIYLIVKSTLVKKNGILLDGTVIGYRQEEGHMFPAVKFIYNNEEFNMTSSIAHKKQKYSEGDSVKIYYVEKDNCVYIDGENGELKNGIIVGLCGIAVIVLKCIKYFI